MGAVGEFQCVGAQLCTQPNTTTARFTMSIIVVTQRWPILLCQSHKLIASDPSPVLKATRVLAFAPQAQALALPPIFGNQVNLVRYEEFRVGVCTEVIAPFFCLQEGRA